jgi:hypothetical protein
MTYHTTEISQASGAPVELYKFTQAGADLGGDVVITEDWSYADQTARNVIWTKATDQAGAYSGGDTGGIGGNDLHVGVQFGGGLGGGGGYAHHTRIFGASDGLLPLTTYHVTIPITLSRPAGFEDCGIIISTGSVPIGEGQLAPGGGSGIFEIDIATDASANIVIRLGHYDLEYGMDGIVILIGDITFEAAAPEEADDTAVHYTSADVPITYDGDEYLPAIIHRGPLDIGGIETTDSDLELRFPRDHEVAEWMKPGGDERPVTCTMFRLHRNDLTLAVTPLIARVVRARFEDLACVLTLAPLSLRVLERVVPRQRYSRGCNHVLYGSQCRASKALHTLVGASVTSISSDGINITVSGLTAHVAAAGVEDPLSGGYVVPLIGPSRGIVGFSGDVITLVAPIAGLLVGALVDVVEGCAHTETSCADQFDNLERYGGFLGIPVRNPFTDDGRGIA